MGSLEEQVEETPPKLEGEGRWLVAMRIGTAQGESVMPVNVESGIPNAYECFIVDGSGSRAGVFYRYEDAAGVEHLTAWQALTPVALEHGKTYWLVFKVVWYSEVVAGALRYFYGISL